MKFPIISKEDFCRYINVLKKMDAKEGLLTDTFREIDENGDVALIALYSLERNAILDLLNTVMEAQIDPHIGSDIEYFCYDLNFGENYKEKPYADWITDEDGTPIDLSTAEKLYDYLVYEHFKRNPKENKK